MRAIQLSLWPDQNGRVDVQCTHCGHRFDARPQLERKAAAVLDDPRVRALPPASLEFLEAALPIMVVTPEPIGPSLLAEKTAYARSTVGEQLQRLAHYGIVVPRLMRPGGKYHRYELAIG